MEITPIDVTIRDLVTEYSDDGEGGVRGYGGLLDIRPPFQREYVYKADKRDEVIRTVKKGFPINVMYWSIHPDSTYEIIDGQQRTISVARYVQGDFSVDDLYFENLQDEEQERILDYPLLVYVCDGEARDKLEWFEIVNIAGEPLSRQELRNAAYFGPWLADAKRHFSQTACPAYQIGQNYVKGVPIRQEFLETALSWISQGEIEDYMGRHQKDANAEELWEHFQAVIDWVKRTFKETRPAMKGVAWGSLYDAHKGEQLNPAEIEVRIQELIADEEVQSHSGIYPYILTGDEKHLNLRTFPKPVKQRVYELQGKKCALCGKEAPVTKMHADHKVPWAENGKTVEDNCQVLCAECNLKKGAK